jgi:hypothetical protein
MNERIRSLLERAEYQARKYPGPDWEVYVEPSREQILEKFAELIVQECIGIAQDRAAFDWAPPNDVNHIINEIKQHFGVER